MELIVAAIIGMYGGAGALMAVMLATPPGSPTRFPFWQAVIFGVFWPVALVIVARRHA